MDQRLLDDTVRFMNGLNLQNRYDQVALAGGAMGARLLNPPTSDWRPVFFDHLQAAINKLHRPIKDVFLLEHLDCGAYKYLHPEKDVKKQYPDANRDEMTAFHRHELNTFAWEVAEFIDEQRKKAEAEFKAAQKACGKEKECWDQVEKLAKEKAEAWTDIRVSYFVMDLLGEVTQLDVPTKQRATLNE
jgi:uncharacterized radical SAM superfamily Fe-S cluster-containing enzyme